MGIVIYTIPGCGECYLLKSLLKSRGIQFTEKSALENKDYLLNAGHSTAPVLEIDGELYSGSFRDLMLILQQKGYLPRETT